MSLESCIDAFNDLSEEDQLRCVDILAWFVSLPEYEQDEILQEVHDYESCDTD